MGSNRPHALSLALSQALASTHGACCTPTALPAVRPEPAGRHRLRTLPPHLYCSIFGTCLTTQHLKKLLGRCTADAIAHFDDLTVHEEMVLLASKSDEGCRLVHKALDQQHQPTIKRFEGARTEDDLLALWDAAKRSGDIPGAYWATLTHRVSSKRVQDKAFGDVHMLSHLVGAANRADIRRLAALEQANAELTTKVEKQQASFRDAMVERDATIRRLSDQVTERLTQGVRPRQESDADAAAQIDTLTQLVASLQRRLSSETSRREKAEAHAQAAGVALGETQTALRAAVELQTALQAEMLAAEAALATPDGEDSDAEALRHAVSGRTVLYVGGRPGSTQAIRDWVRQAGGRFVVHDGGIEQRLGLLAGEVRSADFIFFPVDCISHDAMSSVKRLCQQAGKAYRPLRTASVACFLAGLRNAHAAECEAAAA